MLFFPTFAFCLIKFFTTFNRPEWHLFNWAHIFIKIMGKGLLTILLLIISNSFMTLAWYGHLKFNTDKLLPKWGLLGFIVISWLIAFFEYCFQVPANRIGFKSFGGPFSLMQLKIIQEVITLTVFSIFSITFLKEKFTMNYLYAFICILGAVFFIFKK